ncbi:MAG: flagellar export chaperone FliS [Proteobacteria bacterium]|nr:flagellar export chaperone FliS [Pseudomonadota bacterium]
MNPYTKGRNAYKQAAVNTNDQGTLILMLYDGTIRFLKSAISKLNSSDLEGAHLSIGKAKKIISELRTSLNLDKGGEVGNSLHRLYTYMFNQLVDANVHKDIEKLEEVRKLMVELRDGWKNISKPDQPGQMGPNNRQGNKPLLVKG